MDTKQAVKELRRASGLSFQRFAAELCLSITSIQNYEGGRKPDPRALVAMARLANDIAPDLVGVFMMALAESIGATSIDTHAMTLCIRGVS